MSKCSCSSHPKHPCKDIPKFKEVEVTGFAVYFIDEHGNITGHLTMKG